MSLQFLVSLPMLLNTAPATPSVEDAVSAYVANFLAGDVDALIALWDDQAPEDVVYLAVETAEPLIGTTALRAYYQGLMQTYVIHSATVSEMIIRQHGNQAFALVFVDWTYAAKSGGPIYTYHDRVTVTLTKHGLNWLYQTMHESVAVMP